MSTTQLNFTVRTSPNCKTVHLIGNWDGYKGQLPLSKDASKAGAWKGTFRFQGTTLKPGTRYWYYYIMDGHHVSHDPAKPFTTEPTTGRKLNILDVPAAGAAPAAAETTERARASGSSRRHSTNIPKGRPVSPSRIVSPKPVKPNSPVEQLTRQISAVNLESDSEDDSASDSESDSGSDVPSLSSSRSSNCSSPSSDVSRGSNCSCQRYGITRKGDRVLLDCGGKLCGSDSECSDSESDREVVSTATRRQGIVVRNSHR